MNREFLRRMSFISTRTCSSWRAFFPRRWFASALCTRSPKKGKLLPLSAYVTLCSFSYISPCECRHVHSSRLKTNAIIEKRAYPPPFLCWHFSKSLSLFSSYTRTKGQKKPAEPSIFCASFQLASSILLPVTTICSF